MQLARSLGSFYFFPAIVFLMFAFANPAHAQVANLIQNPGLETAAAGVPSSWSKTFWGTPTPTFTYPVAGRTGNGAAVSFAANSNGDARWQHAPVSVTAGAQYTFSIWYKSTAASEINMEFSNGTGGAITYGWLATLPSSGDVWTQYTGTFTVPTGKARVSVFQLLDKTGVLTIDDISLSSGSTPPPPPNTPTLTLTASPTTVAPGATSVLSWSSTNTSTCTASGGWSGSKALSGSQNVNPTATTTYTLDCSGAGGAVQKQVTVNVAATPPPPPNTPTLTFAANPTSITAGQSSTLTWSSTNVTSCTASGAWSGSKASSGNQVVSPSATASYTLTCTGPGGNVAKQATVTVTASPPPPSGGFQEGMVSLTFDDSWTTQYTNALPILQAANLKGTFYLTTEPIQEEWDEFMTSTQVKDIATKGHEIAGHTVTHADLTTLSQSRARNEVTNSKNYLQNLTGAVVTSFAYPYGAVNNTVKTILRNAGYTNARGVDYDTLNTATTDKYDLKSMCIETSNSLAEIKTEIDKAKANKQWFILCIHEVKNGGDQYTMTPARFQEIVNYIKSVGVKVVTVKEGRALMP